MKARLALLFAAIALGAGSPPGIAAAEASAGELAVVPCEVTRMVRPFFPQWEKSNGVSHGVARLVLRIDPSGRLADALVTAYSNRGFADEALFAVNKWQFRPSLVGGEPAFSTLEVTIEYRVDGLATASLGPSEESNLEAGQYQFHYVPLEKLDRAPAPVAGAAPAYPREWADRGIKGRVVMQYYIDETGRVRMPTVVSADSPQLGWAAVAAVQGWRFQPPTRKGVPVLAKADQTFRFGGD